VGGWFVFFAAAGPSSLEQRRSPTQVLARRFNAAKQKVRDSGLSQSAPISPSSPTCRPSLLSACRPWRTWLGRARISLVAHWRSRLGFLDGPERGERGECANAWRYRSPSSHFVSFITLGSHMPFEQEGLRRVFLMVDQYLSQVGDRASVSGPKAGPGRRPAVAATGEPARPALGLTLTRGTRLRAPPANMEPPCTPAFARSLISRFATNWGRLARPCFRPHSG
jgi:hypothetical protein